MITVTYNTAPGSPVPYRPALGDRPVPYHSTLGSLPVTYSPLLGGPLPYHPAPGGFPLTTQGGQNANPQPVPSDSPMDRYIQAQRAADLSLAWDITPPEVEMLQTRNESLMERQIGSEPLIPTRGIDLSLFTRPQKDQTSSSSSEPSMLQRLPDEVLLRIVSGISDPNDKSSLFAFFALRQVSRRFRRLLQAEDFVNHPFSRKGCCQMCADGCNDKYTSPICPPGGHHCFGYKSVGEVQKIGLKGPFKIKGVWGAGGFGDFIRSYTTCKNCQKSREHRIKADYSTTCKFGPCHSEELLHCHSCERDHPPSCFSQDQAKLPSGRVCIANEGYIRICGHKTLTRAEIKLLLLSEVPDYTPVFVTSCEHPEHKVSCNGNFDYTDQTPRVFAIKTNDLGIMLHVLWQGHSGSDRSILHESGYLHNMTVLGPERIACGHCRYDKSCIVVNYHRKIRFSYQGVNWAPAEWFHAIDRESYVYNGPAGVPETCNIDACRNSYVGKEDQVDQWPQGVNWFCEQDKDKVGDKTCKLVAQEKQCCRDDRRTLESWKGYESEELEETSSPRPQATRTFESQENDEVEDSSCYSLQTLHSSEGHETEESEEVRAPREQPARFR
ncbi:hypothetical protein FBULB1_1933 [Fusarium bulbicola]|nr:hypothetical protein FBULB1_1933 [Fusarium bulbicola]